jgi:AcrR family transcriptional regulator
MPRPRLDKLSPARRAQLLESAAAAFAAHGYAGASLNQILSSAGISKGAAYYYFDDKADLFTTVVRHAWAELLKGADFDIERLDAATLWPKIGALYRGLLNGDGGTPWLIGLAKAVWRLPPDERSGALAPLFDWLRGWFEALVRRGQEIGAIRSDFPGDLVVGIAMAVDEALDRWMLDHVDSVDRAEARATIERVLAALAGALAPRKGNRDGDVPKG